MASFFNQNMHILPKTSHLTPWGAYVWTYPLGRWYLFQRTITMLQFQYDFCYDYSRLHGSNWHIFVKICIVCLNPHICPPGVPMYGLTPWGDGIFFKELFVSGVSGSDLPLLHQIIIYFYNIMCKLLECMKQ